MSTDQKRKQNNDRAQIRFIPCPPEKMAAWRRSMEIITKMILEILEEQRQESSSSQARNGGVFL